VRKASISAWGPKKLGLALATFLLIAEQSPAQAPQSTPPPSEQRSTIKVNVDLKTLYVTVTDRSGRSLTGLRAENFRLYDNEIEQLIAHFTTEDVPFTMGMVLDRSGSMLPVIDEVYQAAFHTVRASKDVDEFSILTFNDRVELRQDFSTDRELLKKRLKRVRAEGGTALYDAVLTALDHVQKGSREKKALLVVTDGDDNKSEHSFRELLDRVRQQEDVTIYVVGFFGSAPWSDFRIYKDSLQARLTELATATGGRAYFPRTMEECDRACIAIAEELRQQYVLGYYPRPRLDGSWHKIQVQLQLPAELAASGLTARTRVGYFAPKE